MGYRYCTAPIKWSSCIIVIILSFIAVSLSAQNKSNSKQNTTSAEFFDLVSINNAFIIHLMEDLSYMQAHIPVQDARLDIMHQRYPYVRLGVMSAFLYETAKNKSGSDYKPQGFASLAPIGLQLPLRGTKNWQTNLYGMMYWANFIDKKSVQKLTLSTYLKDYPKLAEVGVEIELSALITASAGYRKQFWNDSSLKAGSFTGINPDVDYSRWFAEVNIGLQSLYHVEKSLLSPITAARLNLDSDDIGVNVLGSEDSLQIRLELSNTGKTASHDIQLTVSNEMDLPVSVGLSANRIAKLAVNEDTSLILTIKTDANINRSTSGNLIIYAIDKKGNTTDCLISLMIEP